MNLRTLCCFLAVVREESMTHAAQRLHISRPTLPRQIKALGSERRRHFIGCAEPKWDCPVYPGYPSDAKTISRIVPRQPCF